MAKKLRHTVTAAGRTVFLWGDTNKIKEFFPTATVASPAETEIKSVLFKSGTRRRFPGGPTYGGGGGTRSVIVGPPAKQATLPGNPIKCEVTVGTGSAAKVKATQITLQGSFTAAWAIAKATATKPYILRTHNGKPHPVAPVVAP
jgi:hypothetical protein